MATTSTITLLTAAAKTANAAGDSVDLGNKTLVRLVLGCSAVAGTTPKLNVVVETSSDQAAWTQVGAFAEVSAAGQHNLTIGGCSQYLRVRWTITGTGSPSFTFGVTGTAVLAYAIPADLGTLAIPLPALEGISSAEQAEALAAAGDELEGRFNDRYQFPLATWGSDLTTHTCEVAAYKLLTTRGTAPEGSDYSVLKDLRDAAFDWADKVGAKKISPSGIVDSTPAIEESQAVIYCRVPRGW